MARGPRPHQFKCNNLFNEHFSEPFFLPASWSSDNAFVSGAGGLRFKSLAGQIGHSVANGSPPLRHYSKGAVLPGRKEAKMGPANSLHASAYYSENNERILRAKTGKMEVNCY